MQVKEPHGYISDAYDLHETSINWSTGSKSSQQDGFHSL